MDVAIRYKLLEKIGAGSFATVYRAQDQELGREVAVKQIHSQFLAETSQFERYWKEATLLASFQHPNIVTIYDVVRSQGWLVLELMQANIRDRLQGRAMDVKAVQTTLTQGLRALSALHARGLVHGDIKPSNLMIDHRKRVKVGDFGLARRVSHDDGSVIRGTAKYMAPETLSQEFGDVGPQSDLYSLGFTAYELMCGSKFESLFPGLDAFGRDRQAAWMMWHAALDRKLPEPGKALEGVPPALAKVIGKLIEKDPKKRYRSADEALVDLGSPPGEPMTRAAESGPVKKAMTEKSKNRGLIIGLFCVSMALSAAMLFWNPKGAMSTRPTAKLGAGIVRSVDPQSNTIELIDPATGQPEELVVAEKTPIRLRAGGSEELVLLKRLQPGDWIRSWTEDGRLKIDVSRPAKSEGRLVTIDILASAVSVAVENRRQRVRVSLNVPGSAKLLLNGQPARLNDLAPQDRVIVEHVLDPAGKQGELVSRLQAFRERTVTGTISSFDPATAALMLSTDDGSSVSWQVPRDAQIVFDDGTAANLAALEAEQFVTVTGDSTARRIILQKKGAALSGMLIKLDVKQGRMTLQAGRDEFEVTLAKSAQVFLHEKFTALRDLRPQSDRVTVTTSGPDREATVVRAVRIPRFDRCVLAIGSGTNRDRSIPEVPYAADQARNFADIARLRYAVPPEWVQFLNEPSRDEVLAAVGSLAERRPNTQVIVAIVGQVFVVDGSPVLALSDYKTSDAARTALRLDELLTTIDNAPPERKIVLLDVLHPRPGFEDVVPRSPTALFELLPQLKTTALISAGPDVPRPTISLMSHASTALSGPGDTDQDLVLTPDELEKWLSTEQPLTPFERRPGR